MNKVLSAAIITVISATFGFIVKSTKHYIGAISILVVVALYYKSDIVELIKEHNQQSFELEKQKIDHQHFIQQLEIETHQLEIKKKAELEEKARVEEAAEKRRQQLALEKAQAEEAAEKRRQQLALEKAQAEEAAEKRRQQLALEKAQAEEAAEKRRQQLALEKAQAEEAQSKLIANAAPVQLIQPAQTVDLPDFEPVQQMTDEEAIALGIIPAISADGTKRWYQNDQPHRLDGPAVEYSNGTKMWYQNGRLHRDNGPAVEYANGTVEYWINGQELTQLAWTLRIQ